MRGRIAQPIGRLGETSIADLARMIMDRTPMVVDVLLSGRAVFAQRLDSTLGALADRGELVRIGIYNRRSRLDWIIQDLEIYR